MNALLTPEQIADIQGFVDFVTAYNRDPDNRRDGENHCISLLRDREAIAERLEAILRGKSMNAYGHHTVDASSLRALVTAIRGEK